MVLVASVLPAQSLNNQALNGKYFVRQISVVTNDHGSLTDALSLLGTITFDGNGHYTFTGQRLEGSGGAVSSSVSGTYSALPAGIVSMDSPLRSGATINARLGVEALLGSSTELADNTFDLLVAIPAPLAGAAPLIGPYWMSMLEFPSGSGTAVRDSFVGLTFSALGQLQASAYGHAANLSGGQLLSQAITGTYTITNAGTGTLFLGQYTIDSLLSGNRTLYQSADGNVLLGASPGLHDILIGVKSSTAAANNSSWNGNFWSAGLRFDPTARQPDISSYAGSAAARGQGIVTLTRRVKALGSGSYDFTGVDGYSLTASGTGPEGLLQIGIGAGGKAVVGSSLSLNDPGGYEIDFAVQMNSLSGPGVFLNPQGVTSAASFFPPGAPVSPGEFIALFGTGLAGDTGTAPPPYPSTLDGVTVLINNLPAPLSSVSASQINCLVPYATEGSTATIVVQNGGATSNAVTVPLAPTSPSVFSVNQSGTGLGAILHADYTAVNAGKPAAAGETVLVFLTGMGAVDPSVPDGTAGGSNPVSDTTASPISVLVAGAPATVVFSGLAPGFPGLYQMNVTLPSSLPATGNVRLAIQTPNALHAQVDIAVK